MLKIKKGAKPDIFLELLDNRFVSGSGVVEFRGWNGHVLLQSIAENIIGKPGRLKHYEFQEIVRETLYSSDFRNEEGIDGFLRVAETKRREFFGKRPIQYLFSFGIDNFDTFEGVFFKWGDAKVCFLNSERKHQSEWIDEILTERRESYNQEDFRTLPNYREHTVALLLLPARSKGVAIDRANDIFHEVIGLFNLVKNCGQHIRIPFQEWAPLNAFLEFPYTVMHPIGADYLNSRLFFDEYYIDYSDRLPSVHYQKCEIRKMFFKFQQMNSRNPLSQYTGDWLARYNRACQEANWQLSFFRLWSLLEDLTCTSNAKYDTMCRRAAFVFTENLRYRQLFQIIRSFRNELVHGGSEENASSLSGKYMLQLLRHFVDRHLRFRIINSYHIDSIEMLEMILDSPIEKNEILKKRKSLQISSSMLGIDSKK